MKNFGQLDAIKFRADHYKHMNILDELENNRYIEKKDDNYLVGLIALAEISEDTKEVKKLLDNCEKLFQELHKHYRTTPKEAINLSALSKKTRLTQKQVSDSLSVMIKSSIFGAYTTNLYADDASIRPDENILKYGSFSEVIRQQQEWHLNRPPHTPAVPTSRHISQVNTASFDIILHSEIKKHALHQFTNGHLREAVLNSVIAVFDMIRNKTKSSEDGDRLIGKVFSLENPYLILSEIETETGKNDQKGFMQIFKGVYQGVRNPKAHSLTHDLTEEKAAQYLVLSSLLARRVEDATLVQEYHCDNQSEILKRTEAGLI